MEYTKEEIETFRRKANSWGALKKEIGECYPEYDDDGNELPSKFAEKHGVEPDLVTIGEIAATATGWMSFG